MSTKEEVFSKVRTALVDALGVDEEEVTPAAKLVGDLGAESIDFLDIVFRLEKGFDIKIPRGELFPEDILTNAQYVQNGKLTSEGLAQLKGTIDRIHQHLNPQLTIVGVVMTMYDGRTNLAQQVVEEVRRYFPQRICNILIPRSVRLSEAPSYGQLIVEYDPHNRAAQAYSALADELLERAARGVTT